MYYFSHQCQDYVIKSVFPPYNLKSPYLVHTFIIVSTCQPGTSYLTLSSFSWSIDLHVYIKLFPSMSSFHDKISVSITIHTMLITFDPLIDHLVYRSACNNGNKGWGVFVSVITFKSYQPQLLLSLRFPMNLMKYFYRYIE